MIKVIHVLLNEISYVLGVTAYVFVFARISTEYFASYNIVTSIEKMLIVWFFGISSACSVIIGTQIGKKDFKNAYRFGKIYIIFSCFSGIFLGVVLYYNIDFIISFYKVSDKVILGASKILVIVSVILFIRFFNLLVYVGIFRGGADTKFSLITNGLASWLVAVPASFIGAFIFKCSIEWIYALIILEEIFNFIFGVYRFFSKKWMNNIVENIK